VAADWHELTLPWRIMQPSILHYSGAACRHTTPQSATHCLHPTASKLLVTAPTHGRMSRLSWPEWLVTYQDGHPYTNPAQNLAGSLTGNLTGNLLITSPTYNHYCTKPPVIPASNL